MRIWSKVLPYLFAVLASETDEEKHSTDIILRCLQTGKLG